MHEEVFFGRGRDIDKALERLARAEQRGTRFLLLVGESGSGKSSLARAGLVPRIRRGALRGDAETWRVAVMRPGAAGNPVLTLAEALFHDGALPELAHGDFASPEALAGMIADSAKAGAHSIGSALERAGEDLRRRMSGASPDPARLVVVVDQLEELFSP